MLGTGRRDPAELRPPGDVGALCAWLDRLPLSRPKRHLARDFSDGVLVAEIVKHFLPRLVDLHSYVPACSTDQKLSNWSLLNRKVFHKLHFCISEADIQKVVANTPGAIESVLCVLREKMEASTVRVGPTSTADPGLSSVDAVQPWARLTTNPHTGMQSPPDHSSMKSLQNQRPLEKLSYCVCGGWDPAKGPWEHLARVQQQLEDKEQALAILQEAVKILQMKVVRLEHLVQLKDQRIKELLTRPGATCPDSARP